MLAELTTALERRDPATRGHGTRVTALAQAVAIRLGWDEPRLETLRRGGPLHDIGKIVVSPEVLQKPGPLTAAEVAQIRLHPGAGARLLQAVRVRHPGLSCVLFHHERWDGLGYPLGRARTEIPLEARLLAVADAYDAMTSDRPYRLALPAAEALAEVDRCAGTQFDPQLALAFVDVWQTRPEARAAAG